MGPYRSLHRRRREHDDYDVFSYPGTTGGNIALFPPVARSGHSLPTARQPPYTCGARVPMNGRFRSFSA
ncbi:hypothetical protein GCM10020229_29380 [Kitasatospora albolonga]